MRGCSGQAGPSFLPLSFLLLLCFPAAPLGLGHALTPMPPHRRRWEGLSFRLGPLFVCLIDGGRSLRAASLPKFSCPPPGFQSLNADAGPNTLPAVAPREPVVPAPCAASAARGRSPSPVRLPE